MKAYITVTKGMSGHFAVECYWDEELQGWDIWQTGVGRYATRDEAVEEGKAWALDEGLEFRV